VALADAAGEAMHQSPSKDSLVGFASSLAAEPDTR
jgi:hypothetical protein